MQGFAVFGDPSHSSASDTPCKQWVTRFLSGGRKYGTGLPEEFDGVLWWEVIWCGQWCLVGL